MQQKFKIILAQINSTVGDIAGNTERIIGAVEHSRSLKADLVVFPEMALCGYPPEDLLFKPSFLNKSESAMYNIAGKCRDINTIVGFPHFVNGKRYNAAAVIKNGEWTDTYHKVELPNYGVFDEKRYFDAGTSAFFFTLKDYKIALTVCEDLWVAGGKTEQWIKENLADIVINISASPFHADKWNLRKKTISGFARRIGKTVLYANLVGGQDELVFDGGSMVFDSDGKLLNMAKRFKEDFLEVDILANNIGLNNKNNRNVSIDALDEIYSALVLGTGDYIRKNGFKKTVIGLSGGIDSSLVAAIACDAVGPENVVGVTMPSRYSSNATRSDAELLAENLGIKFMEIPIEDIFSTSVKSIFGETKQNEQGLELENLQARIRGNILMTFSNKYGWLVLSTGNKSEMSVGYATLYGDMCGGYAVIKDVPKTLVFKLSEYVNRISGKEIIPDSVIKRPPSAELRPDQKDEDSLPAYPVLDSILQSYIEKDMSFDEVVAQGFDKEIVKQVFQLVDRSEFKRFQAPPGVKITPRAFGKDRRMPVTNRFSTRSE